ncbi:MAG: YdeI/OmpD-associated family protein [Rhodocyclaceae bacterium]|nr:YdeI/OmpD-associated family protein [Rhodocyclaceae bacterium]
MKPQLSGGLVHALPADLSDALHGDPAVAGLWERLSPIARNEFICWVESARQAKTRATRIDRTLETLLAGKRRPCCWPGCIHRTDKRPGRWQQAVLIDSPAKKPSPD